MTQPTPPPPPTDPSAPQFDELDADVPRAPLRRERSISQRFSPFVKHTELAILLLFGVIALGGLGVFNFLNSSKPSSPLSTTGAFRTPAPGATAPGTNDFASSILSEPDHSTNSNVPVAPNQAGQYGAFPNAGGQAQRGQTGAQPPSAIANSSVLQNQLATSATGLNHDTNVPADTVTVPPLQAPPPNPTVPNPNGSNSLLPVPGATTQPALSSIAYPGTNAGDAIMVSGGTAARPPDQPVAPAHTVVQSTAATDASATTPGGSAAPPPVSSADQAATDRRLAFLESNRSRWYVNSIEQDALTQNEVFAGTPVRGSLDDRIVSTMPGKVFGHVTYDVRASLKPYPIVIPVGSTIVGRYDATVRPGDDRVLVAWDYIQMPDGRIFDLGGMSGSENDGSNGLVADVNDHRGRIYTTAFIGSILSAGAQLAQPASATGAYPTVGQTLAGAAGTSIANSTNQILQAKLQEPPTLTVERGRPFMIRLAATAVIDPYYERDRQSGH